MTTPSQERDFFEIPRFTRNGTALTPQQRGALAERLGRCLHCGIRTHSIHLLKRRTPITNDHVYQGHCLAHCDPTNTCIPRNILEALRIRNSYVSAAPAAPVAARRSQNISPDRETESEMESQRQDPLLVLAKVPLHAHLLFVADPSIVHFQFGGEWFCDECGSNTSTRTTTPSRIWHCQEGCDYDLCDTCVSNFARRHPVYHNHHTMVPSSSAQIHQRFGGLWYCDGCQPDGFFGNIPGRTHVEMFSGL